MRSRDSSGGGAGSDAARAGEPPTTDLGRGAIVRALAAVVAVAGVAWGLAAFYDAAGGRERALWGVFRHLLGPWTIGTGSLALGAALVVSTFLTIAAGLLVVALLGIRRATRPEALGLALVFGMAAFGLVGEFLALAHLLDAPALWAATLLLAAAAVARVRRSWRREGWRLTDWGWLARRPDDAALPHVRRLDLRQLRDAPALAPRLDRSLAAALHVMTGALLLVGAWHALLYPVTYWDAMILYVGYARMIFLEGGVPERVCGQVGIGLGANYPHLFSFHHVAMAKMMGLGWSSLYAQAMSPLLAVATALLLHATLRRLGYGVVVAAGATLLLNATPYYLSYVQYASNYLMAIAITAAFCWGAAVFLRERDRASLLVCFAAAAAAVHVNYLMWGLWLAGALLVFGALPLADALARRDGARALPLDAGPHAPGADDDARLDLAPDLASAGRLVRSRWFWTVFAAALALASPWYVRNVIVTGNPVYAFFHEVFPSRHVNPEVMASCTHEWVRNGDGIGTHALQFAQGLRGADEPTFADKLRATPAMFVHGAQAYKLAPFLLAFVLPGLALWMAGLVAERRPAVARLDEPHLRDAFGLLAYGLFLFLLFYHYAVADFYLYQILPAVVPMTFCAAVALHALVRWRGAPGLVARLALLALLGAVWLVPGMAFALMGMKVFAGQTELLALRMPLADTEHVWALRYGDGEVRVWRHMNRHLRGERVLTHENRHLAFDPSITFVHLDDWDVQALYALPTAEAKFDALLDMGLRWYLYVPNEEKHPVNARLELARWVGTPRLEPVVEATPGRSGGAVLYRMRAADAARE